MALVLAFALLPPYYSRHRRKAKGEGGGRDVHGKPTGLADEPAKVPCLDQHHRESELRVKDEDRQSHQLARWQDGKAMGGLSVSCHRAGLQEDNGPQGPVDAPGRPR